MNCNIFSAKIDENGRIAVPAPESGRSYNLFNAFAGMTLDEMNAEIVKIRQFYGLDE